MCTMTNYAKHVSSRKQTPQTEKAAKGQKRNNAGGFSFVVDDWTRLDRFLVLGTDGGTYYVSEKKLTKQNAKCVERLLKNKKDGLRLVNRVVEVSDSGRAPNNDPAIFVLALAASCKEFPEVSKAALEALPKVCRTGTHLLHFASMVNELRGWGRGLRKAVANWYNQKTPDQLAYQLVKYQQRDGWSNKDLLRLSHAGMDAPSQQHNAAYRWVVSGELGNREVVRRDSEGEHVVKYGAVDELPRLISGYEQLKVASSEKEVVRLIQDYRFTHEMVPNDFKNSPAVWEALLEHMPVGAMVRNLGKMTNVGLISPLSDASKKVASKLTNVEVLQKARLHPLAILTALKIYAQGHGMKGSLTWSANQSVVDALDSAFYLAFDAVVPTGKNILLALDASGSMSARLAGSPLSCRDAAATLAMVTARTEQNYHLMYFTSNSHRSYAYPYNRVQSNHLDGIADLNLSPRQRLDTIVSKVARLSWGGTDCSLPMLWASHNKVKVDAFVVLTDNDTWAGSIHPHQALQQYRNEFTPDAKLVVVGMTASKFSIADPNDAGMMDVVGFDTAAPAVLADFIRE